MNKTPSPEYKAAASLFDLRRPASKQALRDFVGEDTISQIEALRQPLVAIVMEGPDKDPKCFAFDDEEGLTGFYRPLLLIEAERQRSEPGRIGVIPRELAPALYEALIEAGKQFALEHVTPAGSA
jgi:hypothetical protein